MRPPTPPPTTRKQRHAAWDIIRRSRGLGFELKSDLENNRIRYRPKDGMPLDLYRELHEHKAHVLLILAALETVIPPDGKPERSESCRFCGKHVWLCPGGVWQCGKCHALWRPQTMTEAAKVSMVNEAREGVKAR